MCQQPLPPQLFKTTEGSQSQKKTIRRNWDFIHLTFKCSEIGSCSHTALLLFTIIWRTFIPDTLRWIVEVTSKRLCYFLVRFRYLCSSLDLNFLGEKSWTWSLLMSSLLSVKVSSWLCVWISGLQSRKWRNWEQLSTPGEPRGLGFYQDDFSWVLSLESGNWLRFQMRTVGN